MFKHTLLALALLVPMALIAKSPVTKEVPFPECFPCDPKTGS